MALYNHKNIPAAVSYNIVDLIKLGPDQCYQYSKSMVAMPDLLLIDITPLHWSVE